MPQNKEAELRRIVIDRMLKEDRGYSIQQIMKECNRELANDSDGLRKVTASNTIREDLRVIDRMLIKKHNVPAYKIVGDYYFIVEMRGEHDKRNKFYRYKNSKISLYTTRFTSQELASIVNAVSILKRFKGMAGFEWVDDMFERFKQHQNVKGDPGKIVGFDENPDLKGKDHFTDLFQAIASQKVLNLTYCDFKHNVEVVYEIHPYFLKQYNKRWFLFGWNATKGFLQNLAFDRIVELEDSHADYIPNTKWDFDTFFNNIIGVTKKDDEAPVLITMHISPITLPYIKTKPLHASQQIIEEGEDGGVITIEVVPNYETEQLILSYGEAIKVLSPESFQKKIARRVSELFANYKSVQLD